MPVREEQLGAVSLVTLDRPEVRNALDREALDGLDAALARAAAPGSGTRCVVLTGAGERVFCAGLDLSAAADGLPEPDSSPLARLRSGYPLPVVAALNGAAVGGGLELALACDLRVAAEHAVFALPEVSLGFAATEGGVQSTRLLPPALALELMLTADRIDAARAYEIGLVNRSVPAEDVLSTALALARRIADHSPVGVRASKELAHRALWEEPAALDRLARARTSELMAGPDAAEGVAAFRERRTPKFRDL